MEDTGGDEGDGNGDGRRADGILRSVQYVPICRHVLSIPPRSPAIHLSTYLPTYYVHATRYSYLYFELCEINLNRARALIFCDSLLLRILLLLSALLTSHPCFSSLLSNGGYCTLRA